jgi:hypothetical protein
MGLPPGNLPQQGALTPNTPLALCQSRDGNGQLVTVESASHYLRNEAVSQEDYDAGDLARQHPCSSYVTRNVRPTPYPISQNRCAALQASMLFQIHQLSANWYSTVPESRLEP